MPHKQILSAHQEMVKERKHFNGNSSSAYSEGRDDGFTELNNGLKDLRSELEKIKNFDKDIMCALSSYLKELNGNISLIATNVISLYDELGKIVNILEKNQIKYEQHDVSIQHLKKTVETLSKASLPSLPAMSNSKQLFASANESSKILPRYGAKVKHIEVNTDHNCPITILSQPAKSITTISAAILPNANTVNTVTIPLATCNNTSPKYSMTDKISQLSSNKTKPLAYTKSLDKASYLSKIQPESLKPFRPYSGVAVASLYSQSLTNGEQSYIDTTPFTYKISECYNSSIKRHDLTNPLGECNSKHAIHYPFIFSKKFDFRLDPSKTLSLNSHRTGYFWHDGHLEPRGMAPLATPENTTTPSLREILPSISTELLKNIAFTRDGISNAMHLPKRSTEYSPTSFKTSNIKVFVSRVEKKQQAEKNVSNSKTSAEEIHNKKTKINLYCLEKPKKQISRPLKFIFSHRKI